MVVSRRKHWSTAAVLALLLGVPLSAHADVRAWVDAPTVTVGRPFWIHLEASGGTVEMPALINVDGISIDARNISRSSSFALSPSGGGTRRDKRSFYAKALVAGEIEIPAFSVTVDGKTEKTDPFTITAVDAPAPGQENRAVQRGAAGDGTQQELRKEDLMFTEALVDRTNVYQGEPILLRLRLWHVKHSNIEAGHRRGGNTRYPSTEGFFVEELESTVTEESRNGWPYQVMEERRLLYPTAIGELRIDSWHVDGIAKVRNPRNFFYSDDYTFDLDTEPITITVRPLPERPADFSGAVGEFELSASLSSDSILQGVPVKLNVNVTGRGNPDAIGDPVVPEMEWAYVSEPTRSTNKEVSLRTKSLTVSKEFVYTITPLNAGDAELGPIRFTYFDPKAEQFRTDTAGPFQITVVKSAEGQQRLVLSDDLNAEKRRVDILGKDIRPIMARPQGLDVESPARAAWPLAAVGPVFLYAAFLVYASRRERFATDRGFARGYHARTNALKGLDAVRESTEPADTLFKTMVDFVSDTYNLDEQGLTSADVDALLAKKNVESAVRSNLTKILRSCERARYASQELRPEEVTALVDAAESCVEELARVAKTGRRP